MVALGVFLLPATVRRTLVFAYTDPSFLTSLTSAFVHLEATHLIVNLGTYLLVVPTVFALSVLSGRRTYFYIAFATFTVAFPVVLSYLNLVEPRVAVGFGLSGVVMAYVGYLPVALANYLEDRFDVGPAVVVAPTVFSFGLALMAALTLRPVIDGNTPLAATVVLGVPVLASTLWSAHSEKQRTRHGDEGDPGRSRQCQRILADPGYAELAVVAFSLLVTMPFVAFPASTAIEGGSVNVFVHLLGFALGFAITYTASALGAQSSSGSDVYRSTTDVTPT
jgi:membrane associated rhomboid family serine protease